MDKKIALPVVGAVPVAASRAAGAMPAPQGGSILDAIDAEVKANKLIIYMKGSPAQPMCGFSARASQILTSFGVPYAHVDVLEDPERREGIKQYGDWPTIPQVYLGGELVGGSDIVLELYQSGELGEMVKKAFAS